MWQGSKYTSGCNYVRVLNSPRFWICQVSPYASVAQDYEYVWIWLNKALWQGCEDASSMFHWVLNKRGLHSVLNMPEYALIISQYAWICLNNAEWVNMPAPTWKKQSAEYARVLNVFDTAHSIRSLYKSLSSY